MTGGDDYEVLAAVPPTRAADFERLAAAARCHRYARSASSRPARDVAIDATGGRRCHRSAGLGSLFRRCAA